MKKLKEKLLGCSMQLRQIILYVLLAAGVFLMLLGYFSYDILFLLGILTLFLMLLYSVLAFRCPHCDAYLGERMIGYSHCPKCGKRIEK